MFLCEKCHPDDNCIMVNLSRGACENCGQPRACKDCHSGKAPKNPIAQEHDLGHKVIVFYRDWQRCPPSFSGKIETDIAFAYTPEKRFFNLEQWCKGRRDFMSKCWTIMNREDPKWDVSSLPRSMCVGDLIVFDDLDLWIVAPSGFTHREDLKDWTRNLVAGAFCKTRNCGVLLTTDYTASREYRECVKCEDHRTDHDITE